MRTGLSISTAAHLGLITLALTGLPFFGAPERQPVQVSEVSIMSEAEFDALRSSAPDTFALDQNLSNPTIDQASVEAPGADARPVATVKDDVEAPSAQDQAANMEDVRTRIENPDVQVAVAEPAPEAPSVFAPSTSGIDSTNALPNAPSSPARPPAPRPADIVASLPQPAPPSPANPAPLPREVTRSDQSEDKADQKEDEENAAPEEATTEISPETSSGDEISPKLAKAAPPRARPADFEEQVAEAEAEVERQQAEAEAAKADQEAEDVAAALAAIAQANEQDAQQSALNARPDVPVGPPISSGERDAFFSQIAACWTFDPG
ncbi:MAG: hypothetical protein AAGA78_18240, partial [Pseudomonadota bacterium]